MLRIKNIHNSSVHKKCIQRLQILTSGNPEMTLELLQKHTKYLLDIKHLYMQSIKIMRKFLFWDIVQQEFTLIFLSDTETCRPPPQEKYPVSLGREVPAETPKA